MDKFELTMTLGESGIAVPDKCKTCPRLGKIASTLSQAQENKNFLIVSSDEEVMAANVRAQLTARVRERFSDALDEQVASTVDNSFANFLNSDRYTDALKYAGSLLEVEDAKIEATLGEVIKLVSECPPEGCSPN